VFHSRRFLRGEEVGFGHEHRLGLLRAAAPLALVARARRVVGVARARVVRVEVVLRLEVLEADVADVAVALLRVREHVRLQRTLVGVVLEARRTLPLPK